MSVTANNAVSGVPAASDDQYIVGNASGTALEINPGDWCVWSGQYIIASHTGIAYNKVSGAGMALTRNPAYDWAGRQVVNSAVVLATRGVFRVSAHFSGNPKMGVLAFPALTGSAVNAPSGQTGVGSLWQTANPTQISANPTGAPNLAVGQVVGWFNSGPAGTGQMDIRVWPVRADYY